MERRRTATLGLAVLSVMVGVMAVAALLWAVENAGASPPMGPVAQGGAPFLLNYQGRLADPTTGLPKPDGTYNITFKIYDADTGGTLIWSETQVVEVTRGLFNVLLGDITPLSASVFDGTSRWLQLEVDEEPLEPRVSIVSVPYAIQAEEAKNADTVDGSHASDFASTTHNHDDRYYTESELSTSDGSAPNTGSNMVHWDNLTGVPAGFADGVDNDTMYSRPGFALTTLDSTGDVGEWTSVTIGADGLGLISYYANGDLKVAHCNDTACSSASTYTLDSAWYCRYTSITIGADGLGLISYYDATNGDLKVAHCSNPFCVPYHRRR